MKIRETVEKILAKTPVADLVGALTDALTEQLEGAEERALQEYRDELSVIISPVGVLISAGTWDDEKYDKFISVEDLAKYHASLSDRPHTGEALKKRTDRLAEAIRAVDSILKELDGIEEDAA